MAGTFVPRRSAAAIALVRAFWAAQFAVMVTAMVTNSHVLVEQATGKGIAPAWGKTGA